MVLWISLQENFAKRSGSTKTGYYTYYLSLLPHANKGISNAFWNMPCLSTHMKRTVFQYRTGTL
eukprot:164202-Pelagomonas_calceolata.AAC.1